MRDYIYLMWDTAKVGVTNFRTHPKEEYKIVVLEPLRYNRWDVLRYVRGHGLRDNLKSALIAGGAEGCT